MGTSSFPKGHLGLEPSWKLGGSFQRGHRWRRFILRAQNQLQSTSVEPLALMTVPLADNCAQRLINFSVVSRAALRWKTDLWSVPCNSVKLGRNGISCIRGSDLTYHPEPVAWWWMVLNVSCQVFLFLLFISVTLSEAISLHLFLHIMKIH